MGSPCALPPGRLALSRQSSLFQARPVLLLLLLAKEGGAAVYRPPVPPRGWNSYDSSPAGTNESHVMATARAMTADYSEAGYTYLTLDAGWFGDIEVDAYGRPLPDATAYPSAGPTSSFQPLAEAVRAVKPSARLRFGLWYMGGIPAKTYDLNTPIKGTSYRARDLALNVTYCPRWDRHWGYAVNHSHPAAQAWYDSLVELWDSWTLDMVKIDCINAEDEARGHRRDIVRLSSAFERVAKRDVLFSLSPGGFSNISQLIGVRPYVSMARVTDE